MDRYKFHFLFGGTYLEHRWEGFAIGEGDFLAHLLAGA